LLPARLPKCLAQSAERRRAVLAVVTEAEVFSISDDDVILERNLQELAGL